MPYRSRCCRLSACNHRSPGGGSLALRPVDLLALLTDLTELSLSHSGRLLPGFRRISHLHPPPDMTTAASFAAQSSRYLSPVILDCKGQPFIFLVNRSANAGGSIDT
jgi:hypothetical protein